MHRLAGLPVRQTMLANSALAHHVPNWMAGGGGLHGVMSIAPAVLAGRATVRPPHPCTAPGLAETAYRAAQPARRRHCTCSAGDNPSDGPSTSGRAPAITQAEIEARIAAARARKAAQPTYHCPACDILVGTPSNLAKHMHRCCPDLLDAASWEQVSTGNLPSSRRAPSIHGLQVRCSRHLAASRGTSDACMRRGAYQS